MRNSEAEADAGHARERIAEILRAAMGTPEEDGLEDEIRRLMLHLSIEPPDDIAAMPDPAALPRTPRAALLLRLLRKSSGDMGA